jgi:hypothetical protein
MATAFRTLRTASLALAFAAALCWGNPPEQNAGSPGAKTAQEAKPPAGEWQSLFDGKALGGWRETAFPGHGQVRIEDGSIVLAAGGMTGITWTKWFPKSNYEIRLEAARVAGSDFFCGLTFPVNDSYLTWINGGWGGSIVGLSSLDGEDASENETSVVMQFERNRWYSLRLRVTDESVEAWIDGDRVIGVDIVSRKLALRPGEIELSAPFGFATYYTTGRLRKLEYRILPPLGSEQTAK